MAVSSKPIAPKRKKVVSTNNSDNDDGSVVVRSNRKRVIRPTNIAGPPPAKKSKSAAQPNDSIAGADNPTAPSVEPPALAESVSKALLQSPPTPKVVPISNAPPSSGVSTLSPVKNMTKRPKAKQESANNIWHFFTSRKEAQKKGWDTIYCKTCRSA
jgi:hypothetical protein